MFASEVLWTDVPLVILASKHFLPYGKVYERCGESYTMLISNHTIFYFFISYNRYVTGRVSTWPFFMYLVEGNRLHFLNGKPFIP